MHALITKANESGNLEKLRDQFLKEQYEKSKHKMTTIETMKIYYDIGHEEDCFETIQTGLRMRTAVALEHDRGNTDFTFSDFLNRAFNLSIHRQSRWHSAAISLEFRCVQKLLKRGAILFEPNSNLNLEAG